MYTLQDIKDMYYSDLANDLIGRMSLDLYIKEYFVQVYDEHLTFKGYERAVATYGKMRGL